jgi:hypothetical protein
MAAMADGTPSGPQMHIAGTVPAKPANGWLAILDQLVTDPGRKRLAIIEYDVLRRTVETDDESVRPTLRIRQAEPLTGDLEGKGQELFGDAQSARTGQIALIGSADIPPGEQSPSVS